MNLELFEWDAPDQDETPPNNSDIGATHLALQVDDIDTATERMASRKDVEVLDEPQTNEDGPTAGLTYVYCRVEWGSTLDSSKHPRQCHMLLTPTSSYTVPHPRGHIDLITRTEATPRYTPGWC